MAHFLDEFVKGLKEASFPEPPAGPFHNIHGDSIDYQLPDTGAAILEWVDGTLAILRNGNGDIIGASINGVAKALEYSEKVKKWEAENAKTHA